MHIAFLCNEYPPYKDGGMGSFVQIMARRLVQSGQQVTVVGLYLHYRGLIESDDHGVRVYRLPAKGGLPIHPLQNHWYLGQFLRQLQFDVNRVNNDADIMKNDFTKTQEQFR